MRESGIGYSFQYSSVGFLHINGGAGATSWSGSGWFAAPDGVIAQAPYDAAVSGRSSTSGSWIDSGRYAGLTWSFTLYNMGETAALRQSQADDMMELLDRMTRAEADPVSIYWTTQDGLKTLTSYGLQLVQPASWTTVGGALKSVSFVAQSEVPFAAGNSTSGELTTFTATGGGFSIPLTVPITFTPSGAASMTVANTGSTTFTPFAVNRTTNSTFGGTSGYYMELHGPVNGFAIQRTQTSGGSGAQIMSFPNTSIASGTVVFIDCFNRRMWYVPDAYSGGLPIASAEDTAYPLSVSGMDFANSEWIDFPPGTHTLTMYADGYVSGTTSLICGTGLYAHI